MGAGQVDRPIALLRFDRDVVAASDWIALAQGLLLAVAAIFAWRTYQLAHAEHEEEREEARKSPLRTLVSDVINEVKLLTPKPRSECQQWATCAMT